MTHGLSQTQELRMEKAELLTAMQIQMAVELVNRAFPGGDSRQHSPEFLAAVLETLASNYSATVLASQN